MRPIRLLAATATAIAVLGTACTSTPSTERASVGHAGQQGDAESSQASLSADGRFVAFASRARNMTGADPAAHSDIFLRDRTTGLVDRVSHGLSGAVPNGDSRLPSVSDDGDKVAFSSRASDLLGQADVNGHEDVFVRARANGRTVLVSRSSTGAQANGNSSIADISADGELVTFVSAASNLVPDDTNRTNDVFVHDLLARTTRRVSVDASGGQIDRSSDRPAISGDGSRVAFVTGADLSASDNDTDPDVYLWDRATGSTRFVGLDGVPPHVVADVDISADGRFVSFVATAGTTSAQAWVKDLVTGDLRLVSARSDGRQSNGSASRVSITSDGGHVAFDSTASDLVAGDTAAQSDTFVASRTGQGMARASVGPGGVQSNGFSGIPVVADGGRAVAFESSATNLVTGDTNLHTDVFVHRR